MLKVDNLHKSFATPEGVVNVIDGVGFSVAEGRCYVLLGPSGCGKTTTLRCVAGLEQADGGRIEIGGIVVSDPGRGVFVPVHERSIGMVFQSYAIWPHMDVFENVAYPLRVQPQRLAREEIRSRVMDVLALVGMAPLAERPASRLSGGQQQRVALARALVRKPALLLLDEPLSNLDAQLREAMRQELSELIMRAGVTALFVTHDQAEAFALADTVAVMHRGHIVQEGTPRAIYTRPGSAFIASFLGAANLLQGVVQESGSERCRVRLGGAAGPLLWLPATATDRIGAVDVAIRPEDVQLHGQRPDAEDVLQGTVRRSSFFGGQMEYEIDLGDARLKVMCNPSRVFAEGAPVWLRIDTDRCAVFARPDAAA